MDIVLMAGLVLLAFAAELIDSALGMMYGTLLSPLLIIVGFDPLVTVPALLFSQAIGGLVAAIKHHGYGHANFQLKSPDFKAFLMISLPGLAAVLVGTLFAISVPKVALKAYIAILVFLIGVLIVLNIRMRYSWKKMGMIGLLSSFNKALSGGGFGPFVTGGQIVIGKTSKNSIGVTTLSEVPICLGAFICYLLFNGFSDWNFLIAMSAGAFLGGLLGPRITKRSYEDKLKLAVGIIAFLLGLFLMLNIAGLLDIKGFKV